MLSSALLSGLLPSCRRRPLPLPHLPSRRLRKPRAPLALLSPAPVFFLCWVLATPPGSSVSPGQSEYFLDVSCFTFSLHPPHFPAPQSCLHHPGGSPSPPPREGPAWAPTHARPEGLCSASFLGGPVYPTSPRPGAIFQRASGEGWGGPTCAPHPFPVEGAGTGRRDSPLLQPAVPRLLKTDLSLAPRVLEAASQTRRLSLSLGTQTRCPPGHQG